MFCPQPSGYDFKRHIITLKNQYRQLVPGYYIISHPKGFTVIEHLMDKYRQVCHSVLCAHHGCHSTGRSEQREPYCTGTAGGKSCQRARTVHTRPIKPHRWLKGPADPARKHEGNGRTPTDHFIQDWIPMYIRIDIMKWDSVDLKVKCHPHQAPDKGSSALQKPFHKVNYINYQHLKTSNS